MSNFKEITCIHYNSSNREWAVYYPAKSGKPVGLLIHATGEGSTQLKRYVQPSKCDARYDELIAELGKNKYNNSWNRKLNKGVHYMLGKTASGEYAVAQMLEDKYACWGCGSGKKGSYNYKPTQYIQIEIQDGNDPNETYPIAVEWAAKMCKKYGWSSQNITSHYEAYKAGCASGHTDPKAYFNKINKTMSDFRADVQNILDGQEPPVREKVADKDIVVGGTYYWDGDSQYTNANAAESKAKAALPGVVTIKKIYKLGKSKHPFQVLRVKGLGASVNGFVDAGNFYKAE